MDKIFIASNNDHKLNEINEIFKINDFSCEILCPKTFECHDEPEENGNSFKENAYIKAKYYYDLFHLPTIGEDSGICIDHLDGKPGIYSKRFLQNLNNHDKNEEVIKLLENVDNRKATFYAQICYIDSDGNVNYFLGINEGEIAKIQAGTNGFGYDPIFFIPSMNKTVAELGNHWKNINSHRGKAFKQFIDYVKNK